MPGKKNACPDAAPSPPTVAEVLGDASVPDAVKQRVYEVREVQLGMGMHPRDDSRLTVLYAHGACDPEYATAFDVAHELWMVDQIYKTTLYGEVVEDTMRCIAARLREAYALSWSATWQIVRFYAPTMLKLYMLRASGRSAAPPS